MPNFISKRGHLAPAYSSAAAGAARLMPEPYSSLYLMWVDQHVYEEIAVMSDVCIDHEQFVPVETRQLRNTKTH